MQHIHPPPLLHYELNSNKFQCINKNLKMVSELLSFTITILHGCNHFIDFIFTFVSFVRRFGFWFMSFSCFDQLFMYDSCYLCLILVRLILKFILLFIIEHRSVLISLFVLCDTCVNHFVSTFSIHECFHLLWMSITNMLLMFWELPIPL